METINEVCANSVAKSASDLSAVTLTTRLLPTTATTHSRREHPPDLCKSDSVEDVNSNKIYNKLSLSACSFSSFNYFHYNNLKKQILFQQEKSTAQLDDADYVFVVGASHKCKKRTTTFATKATSVPVKQPLTSPSLALRINHRKKKCHSSGNININKNKTLVAVASVLRHFISLHTAGTTSTTTKTGDGLRIKSAAATRARLRFLPSLGATSFFTLLTLVCLETVLLSTMSSCAKTFYMHWNTSNSIFRIDNTDHIIDVNKGNLAFEFDQVHIICPVYEPGTFENETEKYIIYNVSKVEYETCRITNADPRVIAICDKPQKLMFFTITFRPFTPQPGGLEFLPGNDYYFISTSSKDDLYRRIGGRCSTNNMKVVFKVCCAPEEKNKTTTIISSASSSGVGESIGSGIDAAGNKVNVDVNTPTNINPQHMNTIGINGVSTGLMSNGGNMNGGGNSGVQLKTLNGPSGTSINTNIDQFNRIPIQTNGINVIGSNIGGVGLGTHGGNGILLTPGHGGINMIPTGGGIGQYPSHPGQTGIRINNVPSQQHHPSHKQHGNSNNDDQHYDKHPNEVVKNEELTYNSAASTLHQRCIWKSPFTLLATNMESLILTKFTANGNSISFVCKIVNKIISDKFFNLIISILNTKNKVLNFNPIILLSMLLLSVTYFTFVSPFSSSILISSSSTKFVDACDSEKSSYKPVKSSKTYKKFSINNKIFR